MSEQLYVRTMHARRLVHVTQDLGTAQTNPINSSINGILNIDLSLRGVSEVGKWKAP
jgi:hypothetical protein